MDQLSAIERANPAWGGMDVEQRLEALRQEIQGLRKARDELVKSTQLTHSQIQNHEHSAVNGRVLFPAEVFFQPKPLRRSCDPLR